MKMIKDWIHDFVAIIFSSIYLPIIFFTFIFVAFLLVFEQIDLYFLNRKKKNARAKR